MNDRRVVSHIPFAFARHIVIRVKDNETSVANNVISQLAKHIHSKRGVHFHFQQKITPGLDFNGYPSLLQ